MCVLIDVSGGFFIAKLNVSDGFAMNKEKLLKKLLRKIHDKLSPDPLERLLKKGLKVGKNFNMMGDVIIDSSHAWHIEIGDDVTLAPRVHILAHDASTKMHLDYTRIGKVKIGNKVFIGAGAIILPGVRVGNNVIIGAGSVVTKDVSDGSVMTGNPAKFICSLEDYLARKQTEMTQVPRFEEEYTVMKGVSNDMKIEMNNKMKEGIAYIK